MSDECEGFGDGHFWLNAGLYSSCSFTGNGQSHLPLKLFWKSAIISKH